MAEMAPKRLSNPCFSSSASFSICSPLERTVRALVVISLNPARQGHQGIDLLLQELHVELAIGLLARRGDGERPRELVRQRAALACQ
jgi:hypothetical protein